ncbi:hypothetical protein WR25_07756 [Diploscapter pachys]|uniref:Uncharacterized protein n=1 Tax=Diploscapter pachys TaxID=2018661 RepID=A0A2A2LAQ0_9BILA|nr:hypothetical protein WR25_07756 [Diploscapter pachys]
MMSLVIFLLLVKWSNTCIRTPDMDLPPVETTTETVWSRYDGIQFINVHINTYNHVHVHVHIDIDIHNNNDDDNNNNIYYNRSLFRKFSSISSMW